MGSIFSRRALLAGGASAAIVGFGRSANGQTSPQSEIELVNDAPLGEMGEYDANFLGPAADKAPRGPFIFPSDADSDNAYGIDISHWTKEVPWSELKDLKINYVYIKASQSSRAKDGMFETHWKAAKQHGVPRGAYHWLTPGVSGKDQGEYFVSRMKSGGGLEKADLQPVIDLEWDYLGKSFKRVPLGNGRDKDYWSDFSSGEIVAAVNDCILAVKDGFPSLAVRPIIYTNRSWWDERLAPNVRFAAPVWLADYRQKSYAQHIPRLIVGHEYNLWQFTEKDPSYLMVNITVRSIATR
jgi:lysozyme